MAIKSSKSFYFVCVFDRPLGACQRVVDTTNWVVEVSCRDASGVLCREETMCAAAQAEICSRIHKLEGWRFIAAVRVGQLAASDRAPMVASVDMAKVNI